MLRVKTLQVMFLLQIFLLSGMCWRVLEYLMENGRYDYAHGSGVLQLEMEIIS